MLTKLEYITQITNALALLSRKVEISASLNLLDVNVVAEDFYKDLLNLSLEYKFQNINQIDPNAISIDLGDIDNRIAIQVTSTSNIKKTRKTVEKFIEKKLYEDYDRLIILNLVEVTRHNEGFIGAEDVFQLDTKEDMWDYNDFARKIVGKDLGPLKEIVQFFNEQLRIIPDNPIPKEVKTLMALIDHLSNCENDNAGTGFIKEPDPNGKINERFADHADFLKETFVGLFAIYGPNMETINEMTDIGSFQIQKKSMYLQNYSDKILKECHGDPKLALDTLTEKFAEIIHKSGIEYDETAITFYLVNELTRCNVFPNIKTNG